MEGVRMLATGPDLFCPDCHRWLVRIHDDGLWDLASKAGVQWQVEIFDPFAPPDEVEAIPHEAVCLRPRCRFKRWRRGASKVTVIAVLVLTISSLWQLLVVGLFDPWSLLPASLLALNVVLLARIWQRETRRSE